MTEIRYRRRAGARWRAATLRTFGRAVGDTGHQVEAIDNRTGNTRTLTTGRWHLEVRAGDRWISIARWTNNTPELFESP